MPKLTEAVRSQLARLVEQKRNLQSEMTYVKQQKSDQIKRINSSISYCKDKQQKISYRNEKTRIAEQCSRRLDSIRYQIQQVELMTRSIRSRGW
jgi:hypothetical protein